MTTPNDMIQSQIFDIMGRLNDAVKTASDSISTCNVGEPCYLESLKTAYEKAKYELSIAPSTVKSAEKAYIVAKDGEHVYNDIMKQQATQKAEDDVLLLLEKYITQLEVINTQTEALSVAQEGSGYIDDVLLQTISNNAVSEQYITKTANHILTNDRKSYYEQDKYNNLKWWNRIWFWSYLFLWVIFSLSLFLTNNNYSYLSIMSKVGFILFFILYMFIAKYIVLLLIYFIVFCTTLFPKNVYLQM